MAGSTTNYGLQTLGSGDHLSENGYKFTDADRHRIDQLLHAAVQHQHIGPVAGVTPTSAPVLTLSSSGGTLPSGTRIYYCFTYVDGDGNESAPSSVAFVDVAGAVSSPGAFTLETATTGGTLEAGDYYYILTAYQTSTTVETLASTPVVITVPATTSTNTITINLPSLPSGATGFNIYRRRPTQAHYYYLDSVNMSVATPPTEYEDDGSLAEDCERGLPTSNTTNATNSVTVSIEAALPAIPDGYTWRLYRSYINGNFGDSFLAHITDLEGSTPTIVKEYVDTGSATSPGVPPAVTPGADNPEQIILTDGQEVQGYLPMGLVSGFPLAIEFSFGGTVSVAQGEGVWPCPFEQARVVSVVAALGRTSTSGSSETIVDVNKGTGAATPTYASIFASSADQPRIGVNAQVGNPVTSFQTEYLEAGDVLSVDVDQVGTGAENLTVIVVLHVLVRTGYTTASETWL